jgi:acetyl esterase/lipase
VTSPKPLVLCGSRHFLLATASLLAFIAGGYSSTPTARADEPTAVLNVWPDKPPGEPATSAEPEQDLTKPTDRLIAGARIIKLGHVTTPQMHVYLPAAERSNGTAVVICPGGGFNILAWDLEGTEVAQWLNSLGVAAVVLKYRVPKPTSGPPWQAAVQDAQRAMSLTRSKASDWGIDPQKIGILGFSAGGLTAGHVAVENDKRAYEPIDEADKVPYRPDFAVLIYAGGLIDDKTDQLKPEFVVTKLTPPVFFAHAADDKARCENSVQLFLALNKAGVPSELHVYDAGGHGYGLRFNSQFPVTTWSKRCEEWLMRRGLVKLLPAQAPAPGA